MTGLLTIEERKKRPWPSTHHRVARNRPSMGGNGGNTAIVANPGGGVNRRDRPYAAWSAIEHPPVGVGTEVAPATAGK
ncbi:MAG TPA: hypothetical protein DD670_11660 [Planctomycetaceae bacterium]|nr:hypothetical protein [Planctomycetaceae bacterium]